MKISFRGPSTQSVFLRAWGVALLTCIVSFGLSGGLELPAKQYLTKSDLSRAFEGVGVFQEFPGEIELSLGDFSGQKTKLIVQYTFDAKLQETMESLYAQYRPDYGAFVALDARTGRVLSMVSYTDKAYAGNVDGHLALQATFPSASIFKVVTAAAAIAERNFSRDTVIPFNGRNHTLYKSQILKSKFNRWTRYMTLKEAFARSVNTVFGRIGALTLDPEDLRTYAGRFGFNRKIAADIPIHEGRASISNDPWEIAETASGFTRDTTMSPLQGALIGAAIVNDGITMEPYAVESVHRLDGTPIYSSEPKMALRSVEPEVAAEIRALMVETVRRGTSRGSFRGFSRGRYNFVEVGGKTGSLTGMSPRGKYDWFVGFAEGGSQRIAVAALTIHEKYWKVKSSYLARRAIENLFRGIDLGQADQPTHVSKR